MSRRAAPHRGLDVHYGGAGAGNEADNRPSKTQLKRESESLQRLGAELAALPEDRLAAVAMPERLREAIDEYRRTRSHEGQRRQMQFIGKLMRSADEQTLREAVAASQVGSARETLALHETERWRAEFIADDAAIGRWAEQHPQSDVQQLRSLVRAARRDAAGVAAEARQPRSVRELFQFIKPWITT
jgi:ribosome-associated protein